LQAHRAAVTFAALWGIPEYYTKGG
jgi:hypothetical protein